jgi:hypothetical protein
VYDAVNSYWQCIVNHIQHSACTPVIVHCTGQLNQVRLSC